MLYCVYEHKPLILRFDLSNESVAYIDTNHKVAREIMIRRLVEELYINKSTEVDLTLILTPQHPDKQDDDAYYMGLYYLMCLTAMRTPSV